MANHPVNPPPPSWLELLVSPDPTNVAAPFARVGRFVAVLPSDNSSLLLNMAYQFGVLNFSAPQTNQPPRIEWDIHKLGEMLDALATAAHKQQNFPIDCRADCFWSALQRKETHFALVEDWMFYTPALVLEKRDFIVMRPHPASTAQRELIHLVGMMPVNNSRAVSKLLANLLDIPSQQAVWQRHGRIPVRTDLNSQATNPLYRDRLEIMENIDLTAWPVALKQRQIDIEKRFFALYRDFIEGRLSLEETLDQARKAFGP